MIFQQPIWNFEQDPTDEAMDETSFNLRAYFDRIEDDKMQQYSPTWNDEQLIVWDGNFRDDGELMLFCCERDVDVVSIVECWNNAWRTGIECGDWFNKL